jgi:hypothetical protein
MYWQGLPWPHGCGLHGQARNSSFYILLSELFHVYFANNLFWLHDCPIFPARFYRLREPLADCPIGIFFGQDRVHPVIGQPFLSLILFQQFNTLGQGILKSFSESKFVHFVVHDLLFRVIPQRYRFVVKNHYIRHVFISSLKI